MPKFYVNNPKDLCVVRVDGTISHTPTGRGYWSRFYIDDPRTGTYVSFLPTNAGLDLAYISAEELVPENEKKLRQKLKNAYLHSHQQPKQVVETLAKYFNKVAMLSVDADILRQICEKMV